MESFGVALHSKVLDCLGFGSVSPQYANVIVVALFAVQHLVVGILVVALEDKPAGFPRRLVVSSSSPSNEGCFARLAPGVRA
jgi:hypothetical protein